MTHWPVKRLSELPTEERRKVASEFLAKMAESKGSRSKKYRLELMSSYTEKAVERYRNFGQLQGLSTGDPSIDKLMKGLVPGELTIVAGKTSQGKTSLATNIAANVALAGTPILFVTMAMTHVELTSRYLHLCGGLTEDYQTMSALTAFQLEKQLNWQDIHGLVGNAVREMQVGLVIIDHLHYFTREVQNVAEDIGRVTKEMKRAADDHDRPVMLISHVRKTGKDAATMEDLRGSSLIAQDADIVLMVGRDPEHPEVFGVRIEINRGRGFDPENDTVYLDFDSTKISERVASTLGIRNPFASDATAPSG